MPELNFASKKADPSAVADFLEEMARDLRRGAVTLGSARGSEEHTYPLDLEGTNTVPDGRAGQFKMSWTRPL